MKKITFKQFIIIMCIGVLSVLLIGLSVFSAYTNVNKVKRVVSTQGGTGVEFSSNYLALATDEKSNFELKRISIPPNNSTVEFAVTVCNYVHNNPSLFNKNNISYDIKISLINALNNEAVTDISKYTELSVKKSNMTYNFNNGICTIDSQTLTGGEKSTDIYVITVPESFIQDKINIQVIAIPDNESINHTGNRILARKFTFTEYTENTITWSGHFAETTTENYDGFNYIITGRGKGTITLKWDSSRLEISKIFLENNNLISESNSENYKEIRFEVDSGIKNQYDIQFYKTTSDEYSELNNYVNISFVKADSETQSS